MVKLQNSSIGYRAFAHQAKGCEIFQNTLSTYILPLLLNPMYGRHHSEETKNKIRETKLRKKLLAIVV